jgi:hypothetical protein
MTPLLTNTEWIGFMVVLLTGSSVTSLITYFFLRPKTRAEAAAKRSEGENLDVKTQNEVAERWRQYSRDLEVRITELEKRVDEADRREHIVAIFVYEASSWMRRARDTMEPHQRELVGDPPKADPELFVGLSAHMERSRPPSGGGSVEVTT